MSTMGYVATLQGTEDASVMSLDFENQLFKVNGLSKTLKEILTTSRSTSAGNINEKGLYETTPIDTPRIGYDPITKKCLGLLVEEVRVNTITYSEDFLSADWTKFNSVVWSGQTKGPDGRYTAQTLVNPVVLSGGVWGSARKWATGLVAGEVHTLSCYYKAGSRPSVRHGFYDGTDVYVIYNLLTGQFVSSGGLGATDTYGIEMLDNGWFRVWITHTLQNSEGIQLHIGRNNSAESTPAFSTLHLWGAQLEKATLPTARPTSYIPTRVTFTGRATPATYYDDVTGVMRTAPANVARSSTGRWVNGVLQPVGELRELAVTNQAAPSNSATMYTPRDAYYSDVGEVFVDGLSEFRKLTESTSNATHYALPATFQTVANTYYAMSIFLKGAGRTKVGLYCHNGREAWTSAPSILVDLIAKTATATNCIAQLEEMGNGVFRVTMVVLSSAAPTATNMYPWLLGGDGSSTYQGDGLSGIYVGGYQVEVGATATSYVATPSSFASRATPALMLDATGKVLTVPANVARNDAYKYTNTGKLRAVGLLLEPAATNLLLQSSSFSVSPWAKQTVGASPAPVVTDNAALAPDGTNSAANITLTAASTSDAAILSQSFTCTVGVTYTASIWLKAKNASDVGKVVAMRHAGTNALTPITLTAQWKYVSFPEVAISTTGVMYFGLRPANGSSAGTVELSVWGAQVEQGAGATSHIPTTTSVATRAADAVTNAQVTRAADVSTSVSTTRASETVKLKDTSWYSVEASTFTTEFTPGAPGAGDTSCAFYMRSAASAGKDAVGVRYQSGVRCVLSSPSGLTVSQLLGDPTVAPYTRSKAALAYNSSQVSFSVNGRDVVTTSSPSPVPVELYIGCTGVNQQFANGYIHKLAYLRTKLPDSLVSVASA